MPDAHSDPVDRRRLAAVAGHRNDVRAARASTADADPSVRATAWAALARAGALGVDDLQRAGADPDPAVRRRAAHLAASHDWSSSTSADRSTPVLTLLLVDPDPSVVEVAAWASGEREPPEPGAVATLAGIATGHGDALCREAAVAALGAIGDRRGLRAILAGLGDRAAVRRRAVIALAPFDGPDVESALRRCLDDRDWQVRQTAEDLLDPER